MGGQGRGHRDVVLDRLLSQLVANQAAHDELTAIRRYRLRKSGASLLSGSEIDLGSLQFWSWAVPSLPTDSIAHAVSDNGPLLDTGQVGQRIRDQLDAWAPTMDLIPIPDVAQSCDLLYGFVNQLWLRLLSQEIEAQLARQGARFHRSRAVGPYAFVVNDRLYALSVSPMPTDPRTLCLSFGPALADPDTATIVSEVDLTGGGRHRVARFFLDRSMAALTPAFHEVSSEALVAGDRWIESFVLAQLAAADEESVDRLYSAVRRSLPAEVGEYIRIYLVDPASGGGIHMDRQARRHSLGQLRSAAYRASSVAPVELLTDLLRARFPIGDTVAREIVPNMMTVIKSPLEIPSGNRVGLAQHVIYGPTGMVLQPIGAFDRLWVEAAYPARLRACVEPQLAADTPAILSSIVNLEFHAVGDASELMRSQSRRRPSISDDVDWPA
jgi:hypothetical protein